MPRKSVTSALRFLTTCLIGFVALASGTVRAQEGAESPLTPLPLDDLSGFRPAGANWSVAGDAWTVWDSTALVVEPGHGVVVNRPADHEGDHLFTDWEHGDLELELEYLMPKGSNSGVYLQGRYEVQLFDSWGVQHPRFDDAGGIYRRYDPERPKGQTEFDGHAPRANASRAPGLWQHMRIVFQAPRFDEEGRKIQNARVVEVVHNGVKVQEGVDVTGPTRESAFNDEQPTGPLMIQGDHGAVAFRNIRYRHYQESEPVTLSDVRYTLYTGEFGSLEEMAAVEPARTGESYGYVWDLFGARADRIGTAWEGQVHVPTSGEYRFAIGFNWVDDIPYEEDAVPGLGALIIGGKEVVEHTGAEQYATGSIYLEEGAHPFTLTYFKNRKLWRPIVFFQVQGPGMAPQMLNAPRTLPEPETSAPPMEAEIGAEPFVLRSFVEYGDEKKVNAASVGDPSGVHYTLDLDNGGLLYAWKGDFADVGSMWYGRGMQQLAVPLGLRVLLPDGPTLAFLPNATAPWPATPGGDVYGFKGYALGADRMPVFRYAVGGVNVQERLEPGANGRMLVRRLELSSEAAPGNLWTRLAAGADIREVRPGVFRVDGRYFIRVDEAGGAAPVVRAAGGGEELVVPVRFEAGKAAVSYALVW